MPQPQQLIKTPLGNVQYLDVGTGTPILYFHGTGAGNDAALLLDESLVQSGCRLIIPNRPGYHATTLGTPGSVEFCAELAAELLNHLNIERAVVIGTSGGGMVAAGFARLFPHRTAALILQCALTHSWTAGKWLPHGLGLTLFLFRHRIFTPLLRWQNMRHAKAAHRQPLVGLKHMSGCRFPELCEDPSVLQKMTELAKMTLASAAAPAGIQNDWRIVVGQSGITPNSIHCPTLIIHDPADSLVPFIHAEWSHACIPGSRLLQIHGGGHLIWFGKDFELMHRARVAFIQTAIAAIHRNPESASPT